MSVLCGEEVTFDCCGRLLGTYRAAGSGHRQPYRRGRELRHRAEVGERWRTQKRTSRQGTVG